jgi:hypothetical protein
LIGTVICCISSSVLLIYFSNSSCCDISFGLNTFLNAVEVSVFVGATWDVWIVEWVFAAYSCMWLAVVSAVSMKLGAVPGVYMGPVAECLVHNGSTCLGALPFAD